MKKVLVLAICALMFSVVASAAALDTPCASTMTVGSLMTSGGCWLQDKVFTAFGYSGGGAVTADMVGVNMTFGSPVSGIDIHGFTFAPSTGVGGVWTTSFTLDYTISVIGAPPAANRIVGAADQLNFGTATGIPNLTSGISTKLPTTASYIMNIGTQQGTSTFPGVTTLNSHTVVTIPALGGLNYLVSLEESYTQSSIPEPVTMILIGSGLLGLGFIRRRAKKS